MELTKAASQRQAHERVAFTDRWLQARLRELQSGTLTGRPYWWDLALHQFGARATDKGRLVFFVMARLPGGGAPIRFTVGRYPQMKLEAARKLGQAALEQIAAGIHPGHARREGETKRKAQVAAVKRGSERAFLVAARDFKTLWIAQKKPRTQAEMWRPFEPGGKGVKKKGVKKKGGGLIDLWGTRELDTITRQEVAAVLERLVRAGKGVTANRFRATLSTFWNWAIEAGRANASPVPSRDLFQGEVARDRVLDDAELAVIWRAADAGTYPFAPLVRLLILTGVRRDEAASAQWREFDLEGGTWTIPGARRKAPARKAKAATHVVPLSLEAVELLRSLPRFRGGDFVFSTTGGEKPTSGFSKFRAAFDPLVVAELSRVNEGRAEPLTVNEWRLHDLRRTFATWLEKSVGYGVVKACLGHSKGNLGATAAYVHHDFADEKRDAFARWAKHVAALADPPPDNVKKLEEHREKIRAGRSPA